MLGLTKKQNENNKIKKNRVWYDIRYDKLKNRSQILV